MARSLSVYRLLKPSGPYKFLLRPEFRGAISDGPPVGVISTDGRLIGHISAFDFERRVPHEVAGANNSDERFMGRLYWYEAEPRKPGWIDFLEPVFPDLEAPLSRPVGALLAVTIHDDAGDRHRFAITFGGGRHLLDPTAYLRRYGVKIALNAIYTGGGTSGDLERIRSVKVATVEENPMWTSRQRNRDADFDSFDVDTDLDVLESITGRPKHVDDWGTRVSGSDAFRTNVFEAFGDIAAVCKHVIEYEERHDYETRFDWVDHTHEVTDPDLMAMLERQLIDELNRLHADPGLIEASKLGLAPADLLDWDEVDVFTYSVDDEPHDDLDLATYLAAAGVPTAKRLAEDTVTAWDGAEERMASWPIRYCLDGELILKSNETPPVIRTYVLFDGRFWEVEPTYLADLDAWIGRLNEWAGDLPPALPGEKEGDYNARAAASSSHYLLMDKDLVHVPEVTGDIELCDILSSDGDFVHVKRKVHSSQLSHLFAQGRVAADLMVRSEVFRRRALAKVRKAEQTKQAQANATAAAATPPRHSPKIIDQFATFDEHGLVSSDFNVVYAILADWQGRELVERLPFFSKVNLRKHATDLRTEGFRVSYRRVNQPKQ